MLLLHLLKNITLRHLRYHKGRTLLSMVGIALGVAVFISVQTAIHTAIESFNASVDHVSGKANLQVTSFGRGFSEEAYLKVKKVPGVEAATPVIQYVSKMDEPIGEPLYLLGIDVFSDRPFREYQFYETDDEGLLFLKTPNSIAITEKLANRHGLRRGQKINLIVGSKKVALTITNLLKMEGPAKSLEGNFGLIDIASAQEALEKVGLVDRIDLIVDKSQPIEATERELKKVIPPGVEVRRSDTRSGQIEKMVSAFHLNLTALSFISLIVGMFLIYNAVSISVIQRRREIGILRSIGLTRPQVLTLFIGEAAWIGCLGSLAGIGVGIGLAKLMLYLVSRTITALYILVKAEHLMISPSILMAGFGVGVLATVLSSIGPAREASKIAPKEALALGTLETKIKLRLGQFSLIGVGLLILSLILALQRPVSHRPLFGFLAALLILIGVSFLIPSAITFLNRLLAPLLHRLFGSEGKLASRYLHDSMARTTITIAALMTALSMLISISIMILSFRKTVDLWVEQSINGDVFIFPGSYSITGYSALLPLEVSRQLPSLPGVKAVDSFRALEAEYQGQPAIIASVDGQVFLNMKVIRFTRGNPQAILRQFAAGQAILVTESFSLRHNVKAGDRIRLNTPQGEREFLIAGVFYDYSSDWGMVLLEKKLFQTLWKDETIHSAGIYLKEGVFQESFKEMIRERYSKPYRLFVVSHRELRKEVLKIFDQTFAITYALEFIAIIVAILGIVNSLNALIIERQRDIGIVRAVGAFQRQIQKTTLIEAGMIGFFSHILGLLCGFLLSVLLIYVVNKQSFGWTIQFSIPLWSLVESWLVVMVTSIGAGFIPARRASKMNVVESLRME
ncbi:MAG TPA: FtsX-like permease family protein [Thermodesulfobacteriota bacterium]|nr:FtsX-like permease family protein [Thermodesulfobacteriota bacterium]